MSITDRCDEIIRLIDEVLDGNASETDVRRRPAPASTPLDRGLLPRIRPPLMPVEH